MESGRESDKASWLRPSLCIQAGSNTGRSVQLDSDNDPYSRMDNSDFDLRIETPSDTALVSLLSDSS